MVLFGTLMVIFAPLMVLFGTLIVLCGLLNEMIRIPVALVLVGSVVVNYFLH